MDDKKIAVLIDAENVSGKYIKLILDEVSNYGSATYKRLYGDFQTPSVRAWMKNLRDYAITPVFHRCDGYFIFGQCGWLLYRHLGQ